MTGISPPARNGANYTIYCSLSATSGVTWMRRVQTAYSPGIVRTAIHMARRLISLYTTAAAPCDKIASPRIFSVAFKFMV